MLFLHLKCLLSGLSEDSLSNSRIPVRSEISGVYTCGPLTRLRYVSVKTSDPRPSPQNLFYLAGPLSEWTNAQEWMQVVIWLGEPWGLDEVIQWDAKQRSIRFNGIPILRDLVLSNVPDCGGLEEARKYAVERVLDLRLRGRYSPGALWRLPFSAPLGSRFRAVPSVRSCHGGGGANLHL